MVDYDAIIARLAQGVKRRQVVVGRDRLFSLAKRREVGLVWATTDLSRRAMGKLRLECERFELPLIQHGDSETLGLVTRMPTTKVYIVKRSFSGLKQVLHDLELDPPA